MGATLARELKNRRREVERACFDLLRRLIELNQQNSDVDAPMHRAVGRQPSARLLELAFAADPVTPPGLVPGDSHVNEPLEEVALLGRRFPPLVLELGAAGGLVGWTASQLIGPRG